MTTQRTAFDPELVGFFDEDGKPHGRQPAMLLVVPTAPSLEKDSLVWRGTRGREDENWLIPLRLVSAGKKLVFEFMELSDAPANRILEFASRWGMLGEKAADYPFQPQESSAPGMPRGGLVHVCSAEPSDGVFTEQLERWRHFARQARALLNVAAHLHYGEYGRREDWNVLYPAAAKDDSRWAHQRGFPTPGEAMAIEWARLRTPISNWLEDADVRPRLFFGAPFKPSVFLRGRALFGVLGVQLLFEICRTRGMAVCSGCGEAYDRERRAAPTQRNYCTTCRSKGVPVRDAKRDSDRRKREALLAKPENVASTRDTALKPATKGTKKSKAKGRPTASKPGRNAKKASTRK